MPAAGRGHSARSRGRPKGSGSTGKGAGKGRSRKSTAGSAAAMAGAKAGAAAASAAAYAAYGYNVSKGEEARMAADSNQRLSKNLFSILQGRVCRILQAKIPEPSFKLSSSDSPLALLP